MDDDDLLSEVLLRLPPLPSSLPRASLVCSRWCRLLADPGFLRRFRAHHRTPPLLGFFSTYYGGPSFTPLLDPPDRIPAARFFLPLDHGQRYYVLDCRHGRLLILNRKRLQLLVSDPLTGEQLHLGVPPLLHSNGIVVSNGAVLCAVRGQGHLRDGCSHSGYQVVLFGMDSERTRVFACAYSSETGVWGSVVSVACKSTLVMRAPVTLIGDSLYSIIFGGGGRILQFDLDAHSLSVIKVPPDVSFHYGNCWTMRAEDGGLGLVLLSDFRAQLWKRMPGFDGVAVWARGKTIQLDMLRSTAERENLTLMGFADYDVMLVGTPSGVFMVNILSTKFKKLSDSPNVDIYHPFASFYGASNNMPLHTYFAGKLGSSVFARDGGIDALDL